jgi:hypothetical protein
MEEGGGSRRLVRDEYGNSSLPKSRSKSVYHIGVVTKVPKTASDDWGALCFWHPTDKTGEPEIQEGQFLEEEIERGDRAYEVRLGDFVTFTIDHNTTRTASNKWRFTVKTVAFARMEIGEVVRDTTANSICILDRYRVKHPLNDFTLAYPDWKLSTLHRQLYARHGPVTRRCVTPQAGEKVKFCLSPDQVVLFAAVQASGKVCVI